VEDAWELLRTGQVAMLVIGSDIDLPSVLRLLAKLPETGHTPRITILLTPQMRDLEWSLRELGAVDILTTPVAYRDLVGVVRRAFDLSRSRTLAATKQELKPSLSNH
jgi:FixJ family two-component response regulator